MVPLAIPRSLTLLLFIMCIGSASAQRLGDLLEKNASAYQELKKQNIAADIIRHDLSILFTKPSSEKVFGFIGNDYRRFHIRFISVIRNNSNPFEYFVYGKSMVKNNICDFQGTLTIANAYEWEVSDVPDLRRGVVMGTYRLFENPAQKHVGVFTGNFVCAWYIDKGGVLRYDDLENVADGYSNFQFAGIWKSYSGNIVNPCHWGESRIPLAGDLDHGTGEFYPAEKYHQNGWTNYIDAYGGTAANSQVARAKEREQWWKD